MSTDDALRALLPDPGAIDRVRAMAGRARHLADRTQDAADRARSVSGVDWRSLAAERFRIDLESCSRQVQACADGLEDAATALSRHAGAADERLDELRAAAAAAVELLGQVASVLRHMGPVNPVRGGYR